MQKCMMCGEDIKKTERAYQLKQGDFNNGQYYQFKGKGGGPRMYIHRSCIMRSQWEREHPKLELEAMYYEYLRKGTDKGEVVWKFDTTTLKHFTQEEIDKLLPRLAKKLLKDLDE